MDRKKESRRGIHYKELLFVAIITLHAVSLMLFGRDSDKLKLNGCFDTASFNSDLCCLQFASGHSIPLRLRIFRLQSGFATHASIALRLAVGVAQGHIRRQASPEHGRAPRAGVSGRRPSVTPLSVLAIDVTPARGPTTKGRTHGTFHVSFHASAPSFRSFS
uniref:Uncharacterized protein n=1 Tax=Setaria viridis TaxID=4556 RepID=A0A4U6U0I3_SETVI|nr:hypothetical protein SEVIR_7G322200v2 [Setaria viridis]